MHAHPKSYVQVMFYKSRANIAPQAEMYTYSRCRVEEDNGLRTPSHLHTEFKERKASNRTGTLLKAKIRETEARSKKVPEE